MSLDVSGPIYTEADYLNWLEENGYRNWENNEDGVTPDDYPVVVSIEIVDDQGYIESEVWTYLTEFYNTRLEDPKHSTAREMAWSVLMEDSEAAACALADFLQEKGLKNDNH